MFKQHPVDIAGQRAIEGHDLSFKAANATVDRMADFMRDRTGFAGACTADDLAAAGFTSAEILEYGDIARARAARGMVRTVSPARPRP